MSYILGIDEVGRGAWAGPLVIGAVVLGKPVKGLKDSKLLSRSARVKLADEIFSTAAYVGLGWAEPQEIDGYGLNAAHALACRRAVMRAPECSRIIIDGAFNYLPGYENVKCLIKADRTVPSVSAASIVAKVARDEYMAKLHEDYPVYNFFKNVGYGTKKHQQALSVHGPIPFHRLSFAPVNTLL